MENISERKAYYYGIERANSEYQYCTVSVLIDGEYYHAVDWCVGGRPNKKKSRAEDKNRVLEATKWGWVGMTSCNPPNRSCTSLLGILLSPPSHTNVFSLHETVTLYSIYACRYVQFVCFNTRKLIPFP